MKPAAAVEQFKHGILRVNDSMYQSYLTHILYPRNDNCLMQGRRERKERESGCRVQNVNDRMEPNECDLWKVRVRKLKRIARCNVTI